MSRLMRDFKLEVECLLFIFGLFIFIIGIAGIFFKDASPEPLKGIIQDFGGWVYWCALVGFLLVLGAGYYTFDNLKMRHEFKKLLGTDSKAKFVKNQDRLEFLAWTLTSEHEKRLWEKKKEFGIKS